MVYKFQCDLCETDYVGYTTRHLHQRIGGLTSQDKSEELNVMEKLYNDDVNISVLTAQMERWKGLLKDGDYFCFDD